MLSGVVEDKGQAFGSEGEAVSTWIAPDVLRKDLHKGVSLGWGLRGL